MRLGDKLNLPKPKKYTYEEWRIPMKNLPGRKCPAIHRRTGVNPDLFLDFADNCGQPLKNSSHHVKRASLPTASCSFSLWHASHLGTMVLHKKHSWEIINMRGHVWLAELFVFSSRMEYFSLICNLTAFSFPARQFLHIQLEELKQHHELPAFLLTWHSAAE